jgi:predicted nucleotidyltransferase
MSRLSRLNPNFKAAFDGLKIANAILTKLAQTYNICDAYVFGSCAEGKNTENSDLDLLVVVPNGSDISRYYALVNTPFFSPVAVDWILITQDEFEKNREIGGVSRIAYLTGKKVWPDGSTK